ncbi:Fur family transcriptional regulator, iron response regulator [Azospirillaceae bacterium]
MIQRPFKRALDRLTQAGLRPTRQRLALARLLFDGPDRHITAEQLHGEADRGNMRVSLATVYNTLHQFTSAGLLREVVVEAGKSYFDTNVSLHHHFYDGSSGGLIDIPGEKILVSPLPDPPCGTKIARVDVIVRLAPIIERSGMMREEEENQENVNDDDDIDQEALTLPA